MFAIVTKSRRLSLPLVLFELFDRVVPVVLYAREIYGHNDSCIKKLEIFQRSIYTKTLKLSKSTSSVNMMSQLCYKYNPNHVVIGGDFNMDFSQNSTRFYYRI